MGVFGKTANIFLNTLQNSTPKMTDIQLSISKLYDILLTGKLKLPILDYQYNELLYNVNLSLVNTITNYSETKLIDGKIKKIGYNPIKIATSITGDPIDFLEEIEDTYQNNLLELKQLYVKVNKDLSYHKYLSYAFNNLYNDFIISCDMRKFVRYSNSFPYIFKMQPFNNINDYSSIPLIISSIILFKCYQTAYDFPSNSTELLFSDEFSEESMKQEFKEYIINNSDEISDSIGEFVRNNILLFGEVTDSTVIEYIRNIIKDHLYHFYEIFFDQFEVLGFGDISFILISDINYNILQDNVLHNIHNDFYNSLQNIFNTDSGSWDYFNIQEDVVLSKLVKYYNSHLNHANSCIAVANQFTDSSLYLLNSYILTYNSFVSDFLHDDEHEAFTIKEINSWLSRLLPLNNNSENLLEYIVSHKLKYESYNDSFKMAYFLRFRELLIRFCDNSVFKHFIMSTFVKNIEKEINKHYYVLPEWSLETDKLITFCKSLFMKHLLEFKNGKPKIWGNYIDKLNTIVYNGINNSTLKTNVNSLDGLIKVEREAFEKYYFIFNSFFKSSFLAKHLENSLLKRYSL